MQNSTLLALSLITSIAGLLILTILINTLEPSTIPLNQITEKHLDKTIKTQATINNIIYTPPLTILTLTDSQSQNSSKKLKAISFNPIPAQKNQKAEITGKITKYNQQLQIEILEINPI